MNPVALITQTKSTRALAMLCAIFLLTASAHRTPAAASFQSANSERELDRGFAEMVHPFLETYCLGCHNAEKQKGKLDLDVYSNRDAVAKDYRRWDTVRQKLKAEEMPPDEAKRHPPSELRQRVITWIESMRRYEAQKYAGDPGPVLARRLSNAEYDYTIRDLTAVAIRPAKEFPVDPANQAGFDNSGESLAMSPALLNKYLEAARHVSEHIVLKPDGFVFAPHPVVTETDRDKYSVKRIIDFYQRQPTNYADYFFAAWQFKHRTALGKPRATLSEFATTNRISPKYLATIWSTLSNPQEKAGPIATLQAMWSRLPEPARRPPKDNQTNVAWVGCERLCDFVIALRQKLKPEVNNLTVPGIAAGSQPLVLWKDRQLAANRRRFDPGALRNPGSESRLQPETVSNLVELVLIAPAERSARKACEAAFERFCRTFPDAFYVSERVLIFLKEDKDSRGRLLSAGFHLMTGYFRDDAPLVDLVLDDQQRRELDSLWEEFHFVTLDSIRQYKDFIFFERAEPPRFMYGAEFDFARSEDKDSISEAKIKQLAEAYLAKAQRNGGKAQAIEAIHDYFKSISADIRHMEQARLSAEPSHLKALQTFAERAYRRPLSQAERDDLLAFYRELREKEGLDHEAAIRDVVTSILMSPSFCYRLDPSELTGRPASSGSPDVAATKWKTTPLSDYALASRLSYFLWSSMPDAELLAHSKAADLHRPKVLLAQTRRMLQDGRIRGLATEFGGNWLDFRRFEEHNAVDRERFKTFNNELREAMFEEPIHFFTDIVQRDRSVLDFLQADDTFVNPLLAGHYGMTDISFRSNEWVRVDHASQYGRGGLLPMGVFLTKNAPGLRTSPVKRGYWVVRRVLGEEIPPPPPKVPQLPEDEAKLGELTLREVLARHREDKSCSGCHERFDGIGLVFEGYGPIGERRVCDLGGRPVDTHATFPGGSEGAGIDGLRRYLRERREQEFLDNFCRKMLAYALGRTLLLSDDGTIENMRAKLAANGYRFSEVVETIVTTPQFLNRRDYTESAKR